MNQSLRVMLLTKSDADDPRCERAVDFCRRSFGQLEIERGGWKEPLPQSVERFDGDVLLSYMSRWVVPGRVLERVKQAALNFHPAPPEYPGVGCNNFALYDNASEYGVTCHHMAAKVDAGPIIEVRRFPVFRSDDVASLLDRTYDYLLVTFYDIVTMVAAGKPLPTSPERWQREPFRRDELNELCEIRADMPPEEVQRRIRATTFRRWRPTVTIAGHRFVLDTPADD